jgi:hypothetical protein
MNNRYNITGRSTTLKNYANVYDTIDAIKRIISENHPAVIELSNQLQAETCEETFRNIWNYVRKNIRYQNDAAGREQLRTPQRSMHDKTGDCDDMSILISAILTNLDFEHELWIAAYKKSDQWQHIYPVAYTTNGKRYVIDCVPEIPYFNYEAQPIINKIIVSMKLEELGEAISADMISELTQPFDIDNLQGLDNELDELETIQGLLGTVAIVDEDDDYDTVLSGYDLQTNMLLKQLLEARTALEKEVRNPTEMSQLNNNKTDLILVQNIIDNFDDEDERDAAIEEAISKGTLYANFYKTLQYGLDDAVNGLAGDDDDDMYYLKVMDEQDMFDYESDMEGLGLFKKLKSKIKAKVQKVKEKHPKLAKVGHAIAKFSPATFTLRRSMEPFLRANVFQMAEKLAIGYATEAEAKKLGYNRNEWMQFAIAKNQAEAKWHSLGGDKAYFKKMVMNGRGAKKAGLKGELGVAPAIIAAVAKVFGGIIEFVKKLKLKKADGTFQEDEGSSGSKSSTSSSGSTTSRSSTATRSYPSKQSDSGTDPGDGNVEVDEKSGVTTEITTDESGKEVKIYRDKEGKEIGKFKAFFLKNKTMLIIVAVIITLGIAGLIFWKVRQRSLHGLGAVGLSRKQENFIKRQGLNNRAYASLVREEIKKDKKAVNSTNRKKYYKKIFKEAFDRPLSQKQVVAAQSYNKMYSDVRKLAKAKGGGSKAWRDAWAEVKKKPQLKLPL